MQAVPTTMPISDLRKYQKKVLAQIQTAPVLLTNQGQGAGVLVSVEQWNAISNQLIEAEQLRRNIAAEKAFARMAAGDFVEMTPTEIMAIG